jgi:hypothetical protein
MLTEAGGPTKTLRGWLRRPRNTVAILSWAGFAMLMVAVGAGRVADHPAVRLVGGHGDLAHIVHIEREPSPVGHVHHAYGEQMTPPARFPGVLSLDLADRNLGREPRKRPCAVGGLPLS